MVRVALWMQKAFETWLPKALHCTRCPANPISLEAVNAILWYDASIAPRTPFRWHLPARRWRWTQSWRRRSTNSVGTGQLCRAPFCLFVPCVLSLISASKLNSLNLGSRIDFLSPRTRSDNATIEGRVFYILVMGDEDDYVEVMSFLPVIGIEHEWHSGPD